MNSAEEFVKQKNLFQLGDLPTETPHPKTTSLSEWAKHDISRGLEVLREIDLSALEHILTLRSELKPLFDSVSETLAAHNKVFLVGCGATGRLSISLEYLWRQKHRGSEQVVSLMAGGDVALVHSLEGFEDFPDYGAKHLLQLGFTKDDLLIGASEGGETPYVIGAVEKASQTSKRLPCFLFCNTPEILNKKVERSARVLGNSKIHSVCLETGPMALTGSTRMQASTVLQLVIGLALEFGHNLDLAFSELSAWIKFLRHTSVEPLKSFILKESESYLDQRHTLYEVEDAAITVFTDTTERAPTFNLAPFDHPHFKTEKSSLTYISIPSAQNAEQAWFKLLNRKPRPIEWPDIHPKTSREYLLGFDFGLKALAFRKSLNHSKELDIFKIEMEPSYLRFLFRGVEERFPLAQILPLFDHLTLKMLINMHSTLVMGRLSRFEGNLMTWVYPSNGKLVDRAARYTQIILKAQGHSGFSYDEIVKAQFKAKTDLSPSESIVHKTIQILLNERNLRPGSLEQR